MNNRQTKPYYSREKIILIFRLKNPVQKYWGSLLLSTFVQDLVIPTTMY